jgi:uncharacterized Rmd1/YagE family protein
VKTQYTIKAYNLYDAIAIKLIKSFLVGKLIESSPNELLFQYDGDSYLFIFRFGSIVCFNMTNEQILRETERIKEFVGADLATPTNEIYQVHVGMPVDKVEFGHVELSELSLQKLRLIAMTVGQSTALESFEINADQMLRETATFMQRLKKVGSVPLSSRKLLKLIGTAAGTRQHIINNLAILDPPDETWANKDLEKLFKDLQQSFDIDVRFRALDRKLALVQDNIEIVADLVSSRRSVLLESLIVVLIILEIVLALAEAI